ncbi:MAG TPA: hypothetical protein DCZ33_02790 [Candidatus Aquiluna sp.]|jgi:hypothetical protein|nr:hypothetical protein [Aquiluna sp.]
MQQRDRLRTQVNWSRVRVVTASFLLVVLDRLWKALKAVAWVITVGFVTMIVLIASVFFGKKK